MAPSHTTGDRNSGIERFVSISKMILILLCVFVIMSVFLTWLVMVVWDALEHLSSRPYSLEDLNPFLVFTAPYHPRIDEGHQFRSKAVPVPIPVQSPEQI